MPNDVLTRDDLVQRLARVSHDSWMKQAHRDKGVPREELDPGVTDHDIERAEDIVGELERLCLVKFEVP